MTTFVGIALLNDIAKIDKYIELSIGYWSSQPKPIALVAIDQKSASRSTVNPADEIAMLEAQRSGIHKLISEYKERQGELKKLGFDLQSFEAAEILPPEISDNLPMIKRVLRKKEGTLAKKVDEFTNLELIHTYYNGLDLRATVGPTDFHGMSAFLWASNDEIRSTFKLDPNKGKVITNSPYLLEDREFCQKVNAVFKGDIMRMLGTTDPNFEPDILGMMNSADHPGWPQKPTVGKLTSRDTTAQESGAVAPGSKTLDDANRERQEAFRSRLAAKAQSTEPSTANVPQTAGSSSVAQRGTIFRAKTTASNPPTPAISQPAKSVATTGDAKPLSVRERAEMAAQSARESGGVKETVTVVGVQKATPAAARPQTAATTDAKSVDEGQKSVSDLRTLFGSKAEKSVRAYDNDSSRSVSPTSTVPLDGSSDRSSPVSTASSSVKTAETMLRPKSTKQQAIDIMKEFGLDSSSDLNKPGK